MLTVQEKAVKYIKKVHGILLIRNRVKSVTCWTGTTTSVASLSIEIVKDFKKEETYNEYEYNEIKIYIEDNLILKENANIFILAKIPFMKPLFDSRGIETKKY